MSTSPTFERTVLLWGNQWWIAGAAEPLEFVELASAAAALATHFGGESARIRLVYQPDQFDTAFVTCPNGNRVTLVDALGSEYPALASSAHAWSHEPILRVETEFTTLLHFERAPGLFPLVRQLAESGILVESAWPFTTFLHALPEEWSDSGATTVIAVQSGRACVYQHPADSIRSARAWIHDTAVAEVAGALEGLLRKNPAEPVLVVTAAEEIAAILTRHIPASTSTNVRWLTLSEALKRPVVLSRRHPAQLLPLPPIITAQRAAIAASLAFFALAGWCGATYARDSLAWRTEDASRSVKKTALRAEVAHLRANAGEIAALRSGLSPASVAPRVGSLLRRLSDHVPPEIALVSVATSESELTITGYRAPNAPAGVLDVLAQRLASADGPLRLTAVPVSTSEGRFDLNGEFNE